MSDEKPKFKFPRSLPLCAKRLAALKDQAEALAAQLAPLVAEEGALREHLIETFKKTELDGFKAHGYSFCITTATVPSLDDWAKFYAFARLKGNDDLLTRAVKSDAWRERIEAGKEVPGVTPFNRVGLRVSKEKRNGKA